MDQSSAAWAESLKRRISSAASRNALSHAWMIVGGDAAACYDTALYLAAARMCSSSVRPCMTCRSCSKIFTGVHPDLTVIGGDDRSPIKVDESRALIKNAYIRPNDSEGKVFIIKAAENLNPNSANALLKITEEPPSYVTIILLTGSPQSIPSTLRSRCETIYMKPAPSAAEEIRGSKAESFWSMLRGGDEAGAAAFAVNNEKMSRKELQELIDSLLRLAASAAGNARDGYPRGPLDMAEVFSRAGDLIGFNVSSGNVLSYICAGCFEGGV